MQALHSHLALRVVALSRAIARRHIDGPERALEDVERLSHSLYAYHLFHATGATLLRDLGRVEEAAQADEKALQHATNSAERALIEERLGQTAGGSRREHKARP